MNHHVVSHHALMPIALRPEHIVMARGEGSWLWDEQGRRYLDMVQGWAVNSLGHGHPALVAAITAQAHTLMNPSPAFYNRPAMTLAHQLAESSGLAHVFFANSGAEANEGAIKLARKWGRLHREGAWKIITFADSFHGRTLATMSASGKAGWDTMFAPQVPGFPKARLNDLASVESLVDAETVAIMLEPVQGESGVWPATPAFLQGLRALCDREGMLLICDEVQTGVGRTGRLFAHQAAGVAADIMTLGKGLGGGLPLAALLASESASCFAPGEQGGTFNGNPLCVSAGVAVMTEIGRSGFLQEVAAKGANFAQGLRSLAERHTLGEVRGEGLLLALELGDRDGAGLVTRARDRADTGLLINAPRPHCLRFMPALTISREEIDQCCAMLDELLAG
ncbi:acetylornithine transaminase [Niveibacterium sp. SC-1]|uniref:acetylornithine transaminase n=1 Tax=Niveibacterium sp. SC-1 TaxID=3135646 RepID=UPI00311EF5BC